MLIQFSVKNFRSIKEELTLELFQKSGKELDLTNTFPANMKSSKDLNLLKSVAIYGANGSGKSNVIEALCTARDIILGSASKFEHDEEVPVSPFSFSLKSIDEPSEFVFTFICEGIKYEYGFTATPQRICEEWLFAYPNGKAQSWLYRLYDIEKECYEWSKSSYISGTKKLIQDTTRDNALFLSTAVHLNNKQLKPIFNWFFMNMNAIGVSGLSTNYTAGKIHEDADDGLFKKQVLGFLESADINVSDISVEEVRPEIPEKIMSKLSESVLKEFKKHVSYDVYLGHKMQDSSQLSYLHLNEESDGTKRLFSLITPWLDVLQDGTVLLIDELHNNLHPNIVKYLIDLFHDPVNNPKNAQLIFTTHETSILNSETFRRDQILFCEKDDLQQTTLSALSDFKVRKNSTNLERDYLSGLYGGTPFVNGIKNIHKIN